MLTKGLLAIDPGHHIEALFIKRVADLLETWKRKKVGKWRSLHQQFRPIHSDIYNQCLDFGLHQNKQSSYVFAWLFLKKFDFLIIRYPNYCNMLG